MLHLVNSFWLALQIYFVAKEVNTMKKKIVTTMLAAAILTTGATNVYAADNPFDSYAVTVYDQTTLAVFAAGKDWPITK